MLDPENVEIRELPIDCLVPDSEGRFLRQNIVDAIAAEILAGNNRAPSNPLDVLKKEVNGHITYCVLNGHHRLAAARKAGLTKWHCCIRSNLLPHQIQALKINTLIFQPPLMPKNYTYCILPLWANTTIWNFLINWKKP